jgi:hypothetical protein
MSPNDPATPEVRPTPSVARRLGYALAAMECLQQIAAIADEPHAIPLFHDLRAFADLVAQFSWATESHLLAIRKALPASCTSVDAPDAGGEV